MTHGLPTRTERVRRGLAVTGLAVVTALSGVVLTPSAGAAGFSASTSGVVADTHLVTYQGNGGVGEAPRAQRVVDGESVAVAGNGFVRDGYGFVEWNTRSDLTGTAYRPGASITPAGDVTLYARWAVQAEVHLLTSAGAQVYRTTDPQRIGVFIGSGGFWWASPAADDDLPSPGTIQVRNHGVVIKTLPASPYGFVEFPIPTNLPLGRAEFTATFIPAAAGELAATSEAVGFSIVRATTVTKVTLRQQALSAADRKKFKVRSGMSVSVRVAGVGTRTAAPGSVALTIGGKVTTLKLVNGTAKTRLLPTAAGAKTVVATYRPGLDWWVRSTGRATITVR